MRNNLSFFVFIVTIISMLISFTPEVLSYDCNKIEISRITEDVVCDGSEFIIQISYDDSNFYDLNLLRVFGSKGINFNTFPEIKLNNLNSNLVDLGITCKDIDSAELEFMFYVDSNVVCVKKLDLKNLILPIKNEFNETLILPIEEVKRLQKNALKDESKEFNVFYFILILIGSILSFYILIKFINYLSNRK